MSACNNPVTNGGTLNTWVRYIPLFLHHKLPTGIAIQETEAHTRTTLGSLDTLRMLHPNLGLTGIVDAVTQTLATLGLHGTRLVAQGLKPPTRHYTPTPDDSGLQIAQPASA